MKKGASLVWILIISTALLFISVTTANFVIKESQMSVRMDDSSRAYAAAESGIDWGKYCLETPAECDLTTITPTGIESFGPFNVGGSKYTVTISKTNVSGKIITKIESLGTSSNVNRKLEYIFTPNASLSALPSVGQTFTADGSYVQQFDYWTDGSGLAKIGIGNAGKTNAIYFDHYSYLGVKYFRLVAIKEGRAAVMSDPIELGSLDIAEPYAVRVRIEYFQDLSARLTISQATDAAGGYECLPSPVGISLSGLGLTSTDFTNYYFSSVPAPASLGFGSAYELIVGATSSYVDNMRTLGLE